MKEMTEMEKKAAWKLHYWFNNLRRIEAHEDGSIAIGKTKFPSNSAFLTTGPVMVRGFSVGNGEVDLTITTLDEKIIGVADYNVYDRDEQREEWTIYYDEDITLEDVDAFLKVYKDYLRKISRLDSELAEIKRLWKEVPVD